MLRFILGFFCGGAFGVVMMSLLQVGRMIRKDKEK